MSVCARRSPRWKCRSASAARPTAYPFDAAHWMADDRAVRLVVPWSVASVQTRCRRAGLANGRREPESHPPDHCHQPAARYCSRHHWSERKILGLILERDYPDTSVTGSERDASRNDLVTNSAELPQLSLGGPS